MGCYDRRTRRSMLDKILGTFHQSTRVGNRSTIFSAMEGKARGLVLWKKYNYEYHVFEIGKNHGIIALF